MHKILILTSKSDAHARTVAECLIKKGALPIRWYPEEFLYNQKGIQRISPNGEHFMMIDGEDTIDLMDVDVVWNRRAALPRLPNALDPFDRRFAEAENRMHMRSLWLTLGESAKWVNPMDSIDKSNSKIFQLREAARLGLTIPETLVTNDKTAIVNYIHKNGEGSTIYKTFTPGLWEENNKAFNLYTTAITTQMLPEESNMALTPGIFQRAISKQFEVRVTFFGKQYIAVKIHNTEELDWRPLSSMPNFKLTPLFLPPAIEKKCLSLMDKLGIVFGCFDFIVTPEDEYVFLEVNEMGQFLWIEEILPQLKLLDKFCEFLLSSSERNEKPSFSAYQQPVSLKEITESVSHHQLIQEDVQKYKHFENNFAFSARY